MESTTIVPPLLNNEQIIKSVKLRNSSKRPLVISEFTASRSTRKEERIISFQGSELFWPIKLTLILEKERKHH